MNTVREVLVVEDNYDICEMIKDILGEQGYNVTIARNTKTALEAAEKIKPHLIILDIWLEGNHLDGIGLLKKLKQMFNEVPIIMISGHANVELAASTIRFGAYDFIEKPFKTEKLLIVVKRALEARDLIEINTYLQHNPGLGLSYKISSGQSKAAQKLRQEIKAIANSNCRIIISGEIGTQPSLVAKEIHENSPRSQKPFITLSTTCNGNYDELNRIICGTDNEQSIFERASGGTLVLENLHTIPLNIQSRILDALQRDSITRNEKTIKFDVRVIGTFEVEKDAEVVDFVKSRLLNEMLYHRLNVKNLQIPSLRSRVDDIIHLFTLAIKSQLDKFSKINIECLKHALTSYNWPCNTQELCNTAEYTLIMMKMTNSGTITIDMLHPNILGIVKSDFASFANITEYLDKDYKSAKRHFDIEYIKAQLRRFSNNVAKTARFMGVDRAALYRKIRSLLGLQKSGDKKIVHLINKEIEKNKKNEGAVM